jgi:hypothetical protein
MSKRAIDIETGNFWFGAPPRGDDDKTQRSILWMVSALIIATLAINWIVGG